VALPADERGLRAGHPRRVGDGGVGSAREMQGETPQRIAVRRDVLASLAVTGLAGEAEFTHLRVKLAAGDEPRPALRDMAVHARAVPFARRVKLPGVRRQQEGRLHRRPLFFRHQAGQRELLERPALARRQPENLQRVRARGNTTSRGAP